MEVIGGGVMRERVIANRIGIVGLTALVATCVSLSPAKAAGSESDKGEKKVAMGDLPSAVRAAAEKLTAGGAVKRIVLEREDGKDAYSVEANVAGKAKEFTFAADGVLLAEEEDLPFAQLPDSVRLAAEKYFGGSRGLHASTEIAKGVTSYEVEGQKNGLGMSLKFNAGGALLGEEKDED
jgi:uncharacterized membrane protein YkoI